MKDNVNNPEHYTGGNIECIDAILEAVKGKKPQEAYLTGNVIKYLWRYERKNGKEDILKAQWYINKLVEITAD